VLVLVCAHIVVGLVAAANRPLPRTSAQPCICRTALSSAPLTPMPRWCAPRAGAASSSSTTAAR